MSVQITIIICSILSLRSTPEISLNDITVQIGRWFWDTVRNEKNLLYIIIRWTKVVCYTLTKLGVIYYLNVHIRSSNIESTILFRFLTALSAASVVSSSSLYSLDRSGAFVNRPFWSDLDLFSNGGGEQTLSLISYFMITKQFSCISNLVHISSPRSFPWDFRLTNSVLPSFCNQ